MVSIEIKSAVSVSVTPIESELRRVTAEVEAAAQWTVSYPRSLCPGNRNEAIDGVAGAEPASAEGQTYSGRQRQCDAIGVSPRSPLKGKPLTASAGAAQMIRTTGG